MMQMNTLGPVPGVPSLRTGTPVSTSPAGIPGHEGNSMPRRPKLPFDALPGLPSHDDKEVAALMEAVELLPREGANQVARCLLRAALGYERAKDTGYLTCLAEDTLFTMRLRSHPQSKSAFDEAGCADQTGGRQLEELFARHG
jgi:hypothetical protein